MKFLVPSINFLIWSLTLTLVTCLPLHTHDKNTHRPGYTRNITAEDLADKPWPEPTYLSSVTEGSAETDEEIQESFGIKDVSNMKDLPLIKRSISVKFINQDEDFGGNELREHLGSRIKRDTKKTNDGKPKFEFFEQLRESSNNIREDTSVLFIIMAILLCLLCLYYYCSCCIFIYYLKSQFCFDIDLYKKPEAVCPTKTCCDRRCSC